jgi:hypothetical protein
MEMSHLGVSVAERITSHQLPEAQQPQQQRQFTFGVWLCSLHSVHDEEKPFELELSWVCEESNNEFSRVPAELVKEATDAAKAALADSDMCAPCECGCLFPHPTAVALLVYRQVRQVVQLHSLYLISTAFTCLLLQGGLRRQILAY